jgi:hypothetical protein
MKHLSSPHWLLLLAFLALCAGAPPARAQGRGGPRFAVGTDCLRWLLKNARLESFSNPGDLNSHKDQSQRILIVLGDLKWLDKQVPGGLGSFVEQGGALLAAGDVESGSALTSLTGLRIHAAAHVEFFQHPKECHKEQSDRPYVIPGPAQLPDGSDNPFAGLRVATNIPTFLEPAWKGQGQLVQLASFPVGVVTVADASEDKRIAPLATSALPFAAGGPVGEGRALFLADHSVFINEMILADECDNFEFTLRCLEWLKSDGQRRYCMLVDGGRVVPNFDVALKRVPPVPPLKVLEELYVHRDEITEAAQRKFAETDQKDPVNASLLRSFSARPREGVARLQRYTLWVLGGFWAVFVLYRLSNHGRYFHDNHLPLLGPTVESQRPGGPLAEVRQRGQIEAGNLWESARELARESLSQAPFADGLPPRPEVAAGNWRRRRKAARRIERLWHIAYGTEPVPVPPERWEAFLGDLESFEHDIADGTVTLPAT